MSVTTLFSDSPPADRIELWRYMKISTLFMLLEGKAFFPSVAKLKSGDPLEGDLVPEEEWLMSKLTSAQGEGTSLIRWLKEQANGVERMFLKNGDITRILADIYTRELAKRRAVWCWFGGSDESAGMWSVYGSAGIAAKTRLQDLKEALPSSLDFQIANIRYVNRRTWPLFFNPEAAANQDLIHRPHLFKGIEYGHEHEIRVTTTCLPDENGRLVTGINTAALVKEVVISPLSPFSEAEALTGQIRKHEVWKNHPPDIGRSSILGRIADEEERWDKISSLMPKPVQENGLPPPLNEL